LGRPPTDEALVCGHEVAALIPTIAGRADGDRLTAPLLRPARLLGRGLRQSIWPHTGQQGPRPKTGVDQYAGAVVAAGLRFGKRKVQ
jgi:hypothetical protein